MEQEIIVRKLNPSTLLRPLLVGAALITLPFWIVGLVASLLGGATINGEHVTGTPAVLWMLDSGRSSPSLWAYSCGST